jgi:diacylglycerol kinase
MNRHTNIIQSTGSGLRGARHGIFGRNFRTMIVFGMIAIFLTCYLPLTAEQQHIIIILVAMILAGELFNSSIEELADVLIQEHHPGIAKVKELAAGATLILVVASIVIGVRIFLPYFW